MRSIHARRALLGVLTMLTLCATSTVARADSVTDWNATAAAALQSPGTAVPPGAGQGAQSTVHLAMVHGAIYDAVNAIDKGHQPYLGGLSAPSSASKDAAVAQAAHDVLLGLMPTMSQAVTDAVNLLLSNSLGPIDPGQAKTDGIAIGAAAAAAMLAARANDGRFALT